jgi:hypothetical protein
MSGVHINNLRIIENAENAPSSPANLRNKITEVILNSSVTRARVEALNPETGEYRVVLQGTLDREETGFQEN